MTLPQMRNLHVSAMVKSLALKEQYHRGNLRKKVLLKTTRKRYKQPLQMTKVPKQCKEEDLKSDVKIKDYGFNLASVSLPSLICWILVMLGGFVCSFVYRKL